MACRTGIACFIAAVMAHLLASLSLLLWQTSCLYPRCIDGLGFDIVRAIMRVPLFITPYLSLPSPDADFVRGWTLFGLLIVNAMMAVALYLGMTIAACRGYAWWRTRKRSQSKAA